MSTILLPDDHLILLALAQHQAACLSGTERTFADLQATVASLRRLNEAEVMDAYPECNMNEMRAYWFASPSIKVTPQDVGRLLYGMPRAEDLRGMFDCLTYNADKAQVESLLSDLDAILPPAKPIPISRQALLHAGGRVTWVHNPAGRMSLFEKIQSVGGEMHTSEYLASAKPVDLITALGPLSADEARLLRGYFGAEVYDDAFRKAFDSIGADFSMTFCSNDLWASQSIRLHAAAVGDQPNEFVKNSAMGMS